MKQRWTEQKDARRDLNKCDRSCPPRTGVELYDRDTFPELIEERLLAFVSTVLPLENQQDRCRLGNSHAQTDRILREVRSKHRNATVSHESYPVRSIWA